MNYFDKELMVLSAELGDAKGECISTQLRVAKSSMYTLVDLVKQLERDIETISQLPVQTTT